MDINEIQQSLIKEKAQGSTITHLLLLGLWWGRASCGSSAPKVQAADEQVFLLGILALEQL